TSTLSLHDALPIYLLHIGRAAHANAVDDFLRHGDRAGVRAFRRFLLAFFLLHVLFGLERRLDADERYAPVRQFLRQLEQLIGVGFLRRIRQQQRNEDLELLAIHAFVHADSADA